VAEKLFARQTTDGLWQWRICNADGEWASDVYHTGDAEALAEAARNNNLPVTLLLAGEKVVCTSTRFDPKEKRHLARLLPYELEDEVIGNVDELHLAYTFTGEDTLAVAYMAGEHVQTAMQPLLDLGCDIRLVLPDYLTLRRENSGVTVIMDDHQVIVRIDKHQGFTTELMLAPIVLSGQTRALDFTGTVNLIAETEEQLNRLQSWLPEAWIHEEGPEIKREIGGLWDWLDTGDLDTELNLRRGSYSRQIPLKRWLMQWKVPLIAAAAAYVIAIGVAFGQYQVAKSENKAIVAEMNDVYIKAVPNGRRGDPEGRLKRLVGGIQSKSGSEPSNLVFLLAGVAPEMKKADIKLSSFRYNADQRELTMNIEGKTFGDLEALRSAAERKGFSAELLRVEARGDSQSARMKVSEGSK